MKFTNQSKFFAFLLVFILPVAVLAGLFTRDETTKFHRDNPVDQRATNYQGYQSVDADGDGMGDYAISINGGLAETENRTVNLTVSGPRANRIFVAESEFALSTVSPTEWNTSIPYTILSSSYGVKNIYVQFEMYGGRRSKKFLKSITLVAPMDPIAWETNAFGLEIENGSTFTTNSNISVSVTAPTYAIQISWGESSNEAVTTAPRNYTNRFSFTFLSNLTNVNTRQIWARIKNSLGQTRMTQASIVYVPWRDFGVTIDGGAAENSTRTCTLAFSILDSVTKIKVANDPSFSGNSWENPTPTKGWYLTNGPGLKTVYLQVTNETYGIYFPPVSNSIQIPAFNGEHIEMAGGAFGSRSNNVWVSMFCSNATHMIVGTDSIFSGRSWEDYATNKIWALSGDGSDNSNYCFVRYSNQIWETVSSIASDWIVYGTNFRFNTLNQEYLKLEGGTFVQGQNGVATPLQNCTISPMYISRFETRYAEWTNVLFWASNHGYGFNGLGWKGSQNSGSANQPVTEVSWYDAVKWCNALSEKEGRVPCYYTNSACNPSQVFRSGEFPINTNMVLWHSNGYRLPTEAEWEYACRAGTTSSYFWGEASGSLAGNYSWFNYNNYPNGTKECGSKITNPWNLFDMTGNVAEYCFDVFASYSGGNKINPLGTDIYNGNSRVYRGGGYLHVSNDLKSSFRCDIYPYQFSQYIGFRMLIANP